MVSTWLLLTLNCPLMTSLRNMKRCLGIPLHRKLWKCPLVPPRSISKGTCSQRTLPQAIAFCCKLMLLQTRKRWSNGRMAWHWKLDWHVIKDHAAFTVPPRWCPAASSNWKAWANDSTAICLSAQWRILSRTTNGWPKRVQAFHPWTLLMKRMWYRLPLPVFCPVCRDFMRQW